MALRNPIDHNRITDLIRSGVDTIPSWWWVTATAALLLAVLALVCAWALTARRHRNPPPATATATDTATDPPPPRVMYLVAVMAVAVSADTSWRFFGAKLGITGLERVVMFAVLEVAFIACGVVMRTNTRRKRPLGMAQPFLWLLTAASAWSALQLSGLAAGIARIVFGPVIGIVALHIALGVEKAPRGDATSTWRRVLTELREWLLSLIGLGNTGRDAVVLRQQRAARRAARLAIQLAALPTQAPPDDVERPARWKRPADLLRPRKRARTVQHLQRALHKANVAHDPHRRHVLLAELAMLRYVEELATLPQTSPWTPVTAAPSPAPSTSRNRNRPPSTRNPATSSATSATASAPSTSRNRHRPTGTRNPATSSATGSRPATTTPATGGATSATASAPSTSRNPATTSATSAPAGATAPATSDTATDTPLPTPAATPGAPVSTPAVADDPAAMSPTARMRRAFEAHVAAGTLDTLTGGELSRIGGCSDTFGRRCIAEWKAQLANGTYTPLEAP